VVEEAVHALPGLFEQVIQMGAILQWVTRIVGAHAQYLDIVAQ
jgi:hypothetical protein